MSAAAPEPRTVTGHGTGEFESWQLTMRADFSARNLGDLFSGDPLRIIAMADTLAVSHNLTDADGKPVASILDAVPWDGVLSVVNGTLGELTKLPNR